MPYYMYVALQEDNKIAVLTIDAHTGTLTPQGEVPVPGGPFTLAISPDRTFLYAGCRDTPQIASFAVNPSTGGLTQNGASRWTRGPSTSPRTAKANLCCRPITKADMSRSIRLGTMDRWGAPPSNGWPRRRGPRHADRPDQSLRLCAPYRG